MRERGFVSCGARAARALAPPRERRPVVGDLRIGVNLVGATVDLTGMDAFVADNGLIAIWSDYGYVRAFDVVAPTVLLPDESQRDSRETLA
jgi:hypothetical protein